MLVYLCQRLALFTCVIVSASALAQAPVRSTPSPDFNPTIDAARLLTQGAFGANRSEINRVAGIGANAWINEQFAKPQVLHVPRVLGYLQANEPFYLTADGSLWKQFFEGEDQLRQRVVFALSQITVVSMRAPTLLNNPCAPAAYVDVLGKHAFGNFRDLIKDLTLTPAMGEYLDMKKSGKTFTVTNPDGATIKFYPNENFARELLQLFTVGTVQLNLDGSPKLDGTGKPIPAYDESMVKGVAQALTGWTFASVPAQDPDWNQPSRWLYAFYPIDASFPDPAVRLRLRCEQWVSPMEPWPFEREQPARFDYCNEPGQLATYPKCLKPHLPPPHDTGSKKVLGGVTIPAGQTPMQDLDATIDNIFNHPNVGPFIGKQLIQRLTMSNPSGPYVERVAKAFNDNGKGVRGDMKAVIRAILLDPDVRLHLRAEGPLAGKLKEPVVRWVSFLRAFGAKAASGKYLLEDFNEPTALYQSPLRAPSVFNFYRPDNPLPGQPSVSPVLAPEFGLATATAVAGWATFTDYRMIRGYGDPTGPNAADAIRPDFSALLPLAQNNPTKLIDELALLLMQGSISPSFRSELITSVSNASIDQYRPVEERLYMALWLIANSPEFLIQK